MKHVAANIYSCLVSAKAAWWFKLATKNVETVQRSLLKKILSENQHTEYGTKNGFGEIRSYAQYRQKIPLIDYSDIQTYIDKIYAGETDILFKGCPICLQPTSGTTSGKKLIPFTRDLQKQYHRGVATWVFDLLVNDYDLIFGKWFWSLSPSGSETQNNPAGIPIGFLDDTEYLGSVLGPYLKQSFAVPSEAGNITDNELFRYITLAFLLKTENLALISIWNPSYFLLILDSLDESINSVIQDIVSGQLSVRDQIPESMREPLCSLFGPASHSRGKALERFYNLFAHDKTQLYAKIWPRLKLLSFWEDAEAKGPAERLKQLFPSIKTQAKGILATEGVVTIPMSNFPAPLLSVRSHFFEFIPLEDDLEAVPAWELKKGAYYKIVLTTAGGLYRYKLNDIVKVVGHFNQCPAFKFLGRGSKTSDFYGEKLHQIHILETIDQVLNFMPSSSYFALLAPDGDTDIDHYTLFLASDINLGKDKLNNICSKFELELRKNFHYDYCRKLGQLKNLEICYLRQDVFSANRIFMGVMEKRGIRSGDIKPAVLDNQSGWKKEFQH